ncbi:MAG TPA: peptidoglycan-binding protein [Acidimicrobiales bacterium]|nr:peptidoglycan-binding protein [Acidimicrobiales bacterium]
MQRTLARRPAEHVREHAVQTRIEPRRARVLEMQRTAGNRAVAGLLQRQGLVATPTPAADPKTHPRLKRGHTGPGVKKLQQMLNARGQEPPLKIDGIFGKKTHDAVVQFQAQKELEPDGKVGRFTWGALEAAAGTPDIDPEEEKLGAHAIAKMDENNTNPHTLDQGVHYSYNYKALCKKEGREDLWKDDYRSGYADPQYFDRIGWMDWKLKPKMSASAAIKSWLRGLTVAECNSTIIAIWIDSLRAAIGDTKFDERFGSTDKVVPIEQRLRVKQGAAGTPVAELVTQTDAAKSGDAGVAGNRPANPGERHYFYNHPKYLLKHPGGAWQGENAVYMGRDPDTNEQLWSGMGAHRKTEHGLLVEMVEAYNADRDAEDERALKERFPDGPPAIYDPANGEFPDQITADLVLSEPEYELDGQKRKGGFVAEAGVKLDADKVEKVAGE